LPPPVPADFILPETRGTANNPDEEWRVLESGELVTGSNDADAFVYFADGFLNVLEGALLQVLRVTKRFYV
jgi:hypothetical protein